jgi:type VI secretion system lysozyme-like protein
MNKSLLFDRFHTVRAMSPKMRDHHELTVKSIEQEISRLLNTRSTIAFSDKPGRKTVIHYGLPDFLHLSPRALRDAQTLAGMISQVIRAFERRIDLSEVIIESPRESRDGLRAQIAGHVRMPHGPVFVSFPVQVAGVLYTSGALA